MAEKVESADKSTRPRAENARIGEVFPVATPVVEASGWLGFQHTSGNLAVQRHLAAGLLQTKPASILQAKPTGSGSSVLEEVANGARSGASGTCACGGTCTSCRAHDEEVVQRKPEVGLAIQRVPNGYAATPLPLGPEPGIATLITEDDVAELAPGQMRRSEFLSRLEGAVCSTTEDALAGTPWSASGCPYLQRWFSYYRARDGQHVERAVRRYAPETASATQADDYIPLIAARVRQAVTTWATTGEVTGLPDDLPLPDLPEMGGGLIASVVGSGIRTGIRATNLLSSATQALGGLLFKRERGDAGTSTDPYVVRSQLGTGHGLHSGVRAHMEQAFDTSFGGVRVHTDSAAAHLSEGLGARAFTVGHDVAFGSSEYRPGTPVGDALIAHELAHVVQQRGGGTTVSRQGGSGVGSGVYEALEEDADVAAVGAVLGRDKSSGVASAALPRLRSGLRLQRCSGSSGPSFEQYQALFNPLWDTAPYNTQSTAFDPTIPGKGPRTPRSQAIFQHIYTTDTAIRTAYDANTGGLRERIDSYVGPEGLNLVGSPRLTALQTAMGVFSKPVSSGDYAAFKTAVQTAAGNLDETDRQAVERSNAWQRLINEYVGGEAERAEIRRIIATRPAAPAPPTPPTPPSPPTPPPSGGTTTQAFLDAIHIDGPTAPISANAREEQVPLTPRSATPNPAVPLSTRFTVTPANRVQGPNISPDSPWPNAATAGIPFEPRIINTGAVGMTAHLDLRNLPSGVSRTTPIPDLNFTVNDNRKAHVVATWFPAVNVWTGAGHTWWTSGMVVRYFGGTQNLEVGAFLPTGATNPGLTLFVRAQVLRGATVVVPAPALQQFPPDQRQIAPFSMPVSAPAVIPAGGDPLTFQVELLDQDRSTVLSTKTVNISVLPEAVYTQAQAEAAATADLAHLTSNAPTGLLGKMTARGGVAANAAAVVNAGRIRLVPMTQRHDSAAYVTAQTGAPDPSKVGYLIGTTYATSMVDVAGAAAFCQRTQRQMLVNRTTDVAAGLRRTDDELITLVTHEMVHCLDERPNANTLEERYKTEFRAYWMDGRYGPPGQGTCPTPPLTCKDTSYNPALPPPGPKSERARAIFDNLYGSATYPWVKPAYDNNTGGFREMADTYLIPDGINLIASLELDRIRAYIESYGWLSSYAAYKAQITLDMAGLSADERAQIRGNRAWRDLAERQFSGSERTEIKTIMGIP